MSKPEDASYFVASELPGITKWPARIGDEEVGAEGGRRGQSWIELDGLGRLDICHWVSPIGRSWDDVAAQRFLVWGRIGVLWVSGVEFRHPRSCEDEIEHPECWEAMTVRTRDKFRRKGIARSLYAHAHSFGYRIGPSDEMLADSPNEGLSGGEALWAKLDPYALENRQSGTSVDPRPALTNVLLEELFAKFGPPTNPQHHPKFELGVLVDINRCAFTDWPV